MRISRSVCKGGIPMGEAIRDTFLSVTGERLGRRLWLPEGPPKALLQVVHGMAEHIDRYDETAKRLNQAGFAVAGHNHLGHGPDAAALGHFARENGWDALIDDTHALRRDLEAKYPGTPYFLLGHSMGSFVVRGYCLKYEKGLAGVLLSGPNHMDAATLAAGSLLANLQCALGGAEKPSRLLQTISFAGYNKKYAPPRTNFDWLTTDTAIVDAYLADPYCGFTFTARAYRDLFIGLKRVAARKLSAMEKDIPVLLLSGDMDPVGLYGDGVKQTASEILNAGVKDVQVKLYEGGRHEMFNEKDKETVWADVIAWMERVLAG